MPYGLPTFQREISGRPGATRIETPKASRGSGMGRGRTPSPAHYGFWGRRELPHRGPGRSLGRKRFLGYRLSNGSMLIRALSSLSVTFVYCGQTVGRITVNLSMRVGLSPRHIVLDGDSAPQKGAQSPMSVVAKRLDALRCHLVWR